MKRNSGEEMKTVNTDAISSVMFLDDIPGAGGARSDLCCPTRRAGACTPGSSGALRAVRGASPPDGVDPA